ncbi:hypothetical protein [Bradyrhizobium sp. JYMT SZCCT0428]|uniref:hypothetical protein n=1 Tax=Bradyrhizobium sp. JYMT SZCCT0428 TaxID=2807673 RepID=UPI001BAA81DE|nr:hypothetical protein [Bradyrhizobium sp. JYMT SZCCT0428]MBR1154623.1 hypothetical protein [Bradyrhizobium sp. JYMT SZCCT0428]
MDLDAERRPLVGLFVLTRFLDANRHPLRLKTLRYNFFVHVRHPSYRLVTKADVPFPSGTSEHEWKLTRSREAGDVNAEVREAVDQNGYSLFRIGLSLSEIPKA